MKTIKPNLNQLFCKPSEKERKTVSGILLTEDTAYKPRTAEVINSGHKDFEKDDEIIYKTYAATEFKLDGVDYLMIDAADVLGTVLTVEE